MYSTGSGDGMPADKLLRLFIIQAISSFVAGDKESGLHYLNEIKQTYAQHMMNLNPTLKSLAKEIIQSLDLLSPGAVAEDLMSANEIPAQPVIQETQPPVEQTAQTPVTASEPASDSPSSVSSELQDLLNKRRARRNK